MVTEFHFPKSQVESSLNNKSGVEVTGKGEYTVVVEIEK